MTSSSPETTIEERIAESRLGRERLDDATQEIDGAVDDAKVKVTEAEEMMSKLEARVMDIKKRIEDQQGVVSRVDGELMLEEEKSVLFQGFARHDRDVEVMV